MDNKNCRKDFKCCEEDIFFDEDKCFDEDKFESIEEIDCCFDEDKGCFTDMLEEVYNEGYEKGKCKGFEKGCRKGYEKAVKEFLCYMKKNRCCLKCCRCHRHYDCSCR
ncbi:hypothetical protein [Clostridium sp.]|uniref:hypothetical protein n=1 Tax=Clostridium sp. TaxID=1506 RepID=UPI00263A0A5E|nr:hypothetical protein [Clostridium sp.]